MSIDLAAIDDDGPLYAAAKKVYPQRVWGTYRRIKWIVLWIALGVYDILPFIRWNRGPDQPGQAVLVDMAHSRFYFFFIELWPQEVYYFTGLLILAALILFLSNALFGRVWCGYACPQTVWTDLFLFVERRIEGDRRDRIKLDEAPWTADKIMKRVAKHAAWLAIALFTGGAAVLYFEDAPTLLKQLLVFQAPPVAYLWIGILTFTTYSLAGHMREQVCLYMCPWPRIQAALTDTDALNVTYRSDRGEPRMSVKEAAKVRAHGEAAGDCIDCMQCVAVCPTGVDIRKGSQLGCIQCGLCIDACDAVMAKVHRPTRLIAYDTDENLERRKRGESGDAEAAQELPFGRLLDTVGSLRREWIGWVSQRLEALEDRRRLERTLVPFHCDALAGQIDPRAAHASLLAQAGLDRGYAGAAMDAFDDEIHRGDTVDGTAYIKR